MHSIKIIITAAIGSGLVLLSVFAYRLGIDHNPGWGSSRVRLAAVGAVLLITAVLSWRWEALKPLRMRIQTPVTQWLSRLVTWWGGLAVVRLVRRERRVVLGWPILRWFAVSPERRAGLAVGFGIVMLCFVYVWYMTSGTLTHWFPFRFEYYDWLAQAFLHGQLALLEKPDPRLLTLANPYVFENRGGIPYPWDVSFFQGKFYMYWGPVPGLMAAAVRLVTHVPVEDQALVLFIQGVVGVLLAANLAAMRAMFAPKSNPFGLMLLILVGGANLYLLWPSGRPAVYEVSILSGQLFLLAGLLAVFTALRDLSLKMFSGFVSGICLILAVGSRATLAAAVGWVVVMAAWRVWFRGVVPVRRTLAFMGAFLIPMLVGGGLLLGYNYARFGNAFETGFTYQLGIPGYPPEPSWLFSSANLVPNLFGYLLRTPRLDGQFPFVGVPFIKESDWPTYIHLPEHYTYNEPQVGLLIIFPLVGLAVVPLIQLSRGFFKKKAREHASIGAGDSFESFWLLLLAGAAVIQMGVIFSYFFSTLRFQIELMPLIVLLTCLSVWWVDRRLAHHPFWQALFWLAVMLLAVYSLGIGLFGAINAGEERFEANNPHLFAAFRDWFNSVLH